MIFTRASRVAVAVGLMTSFQLAGAVHVEAEEAPESSISSPPMEMDDPGTPGSQGLEVNLVGTLSRVGQGRGSESLLDANYGIGDRIQLKYERPYLTQGVAGEQSQKGFGATELGVKWRVVDTGGWEVAVYPQYQFKDGFTLMDEEGNPEEEEGQSAYLPLLISKRLTHVYSVGANVGYKRKDRKSTRLNSSHSRASRMPSSA